MIRFNEISTEVITESVRCSGTCKRIVTCAARADDTIPSTTVYNGTMLCARAMFCAHLKCCVQVQCCAHLKFCVHVQCCVHVQSRISSKIFLCGIRVSDGLVEMDGVSLNIGRNLRSLIV